MSFLSRFWQRYVLGARPAPVVERRRLLRATCDGCGKDIAIIASTGKLWRHTCADFGVPGPMDQHDPPEAAEDGEEGENPGPFDQHDRREEWEGRR